MTRLLVIGTGLIGGSFAAAMRRAGAFEDIVGFDADASAVSRAVRSKIVDRSVDDLGAAVAAADAVLVATPVEAIAATVARIGQRVRANAVVFDTGSVKGAVLDALRAQGPLPAWFVPCHPMAGSERAGPDAADADLFVGRSVIVTPQPQTSRDALARVSDWWRIAGAHVVEVSATVHDEMVALTSHVPHLIAYAFMEWLGSPHAAEPYPFAGPGLQDFTRIAASEPLMWRDILMANRDHVLTELDGWAQTLARFSEALRAGRGEELARLLTSARDARVRLDDALDD